MSELSMESLFGDSEIDFECPSCNGEFEVLLQDVMDDGSIITCPHCNQEIRIDHDDTTKKTLHDGQKAINEFNKTIDKF